MKRTLFLSLLTGLSAAYSYAGDYTLRNGDEYAATLVMTDSSNLTATDEDVAVQRSADGKTAWTAWNYYESQGLYFCDGSGIKFNHSVDVGVTRLYVGDGIGFQTSNNNDAGGINWSSAGAKLVISGDEDAYADINTDAGGYIKVDGMDGGTLYLNSRGYINTTGAELADTNAVHATYSETGAHVTKSGYGVSQDAGAGNIIKLNYTVTRELLAGDYDGWAGEVVLSGFAGDAAVSATDAGLSVSCTGTKEYATRNGEAFGVTALKMDSSQLTDGNQHYLVLKSVDGKATWSNNTLFSIDGLYLEDGAGVKFNHSSNVTVTHLHLGEDIAFQTGTGNSAGAINWSSAGHKLVISGNAGAYADIDSDVGANILVNQMDGGDVYLNAKGFINTTGAELGASNTVHATYSETPTGHITRSGATLLAQGADKSVIRVSAGLERTLLAGDYAGWAGSVELSGFENATVNKTSTGLSVSYGGVLSFATRNGQAFEADALKADSSQLADGTKNYLVLKSGDGNATWTPNNVHSVKGLYLEDGAGVKFNHSSNVTVTYLHLGEGIAFQTSTDNRAGAINWSSAGQKLVMSGEAGAWVDINTNVGGNISLAGMNGGDVYLNTKGHINSSLGGNNTVHATLVALNDGSTSYSYVSGQLMQNYTRTLLSGDFSSWAGSVAFTDADGAAMDNSLYSVKGTNGGLKVTYAISLGAFTGISGVITPSGALDVEGNLTINNVTDLSFKNNRATNAVSDSFANATGLSVTGNVLIDAAGEVVFQNNVADADSCKGGAVNADGSQVRISAASLSMLSNRSDMDGGAVSAAFGAVELATTSGDMAISGNSAWLTGGALSGDSVNLDSAGALTLSDNRSDDNGGAVYAFGGITLHSAGDMTISGNTGDNGGALYSAEGDISLSSDGGDISVTGNTAGSYGGAIKMDGWGGATLDLTASNGDISFSGNEDCTGANDITFAAAGTLNLTAEEGRSITLEGGVNGSDDDAEAVEININQNGETGTVVLGGTSNLAHHTAVGGGKLLLKEDAVLGRSSSGEAELVSYGPAPAAYSGGTGSSFVVDGAEVSAETEGTATIYASSASISNAAVQGIALIIDSDQLVEISGSTLTATAITADTVTLQDSTLTRTTVNAAGTDSNLVLDGTVVVLTDLADTDNVFVGFSTVTGTVTLDITLEALREAAGREIVINLFDAVCSANGGTLELRFSDTLTEILTGAGADFGFDTLAAGDRNQVINLTDGTAGFSINLVNVTAEQLIPEPATASLGLLALAALCARRRRKAC